MGTSLFGPPGEAGAARPGLCSGGPGTFGHVFSFRVSFSLAFLNAGYT